MLIHRIKLKNILSFGPDGMELELKPLNVLIGPNGSGKSNLIEVMGLLQAAPRELTAPMIAGGGIANWIWRGEQTTHSAAKPVLAEVEAVLNYPNGSQVLGHSLTFTETSHRFELRNERIEGQPRTTFFEAAPQVFFELQDGRPTLHNKKENRRSLFLFKREQSVLAQIRDPDRYPELTWLGDTYPRIRLYREWSFGRTTPPRLPQGRCPAKRFSN